MVYPQLLYSIALAFVRLNYRDRFFSHLQQHKIWMSSLMWPIINQLLDHYTTCKLKTARLHSVFDVLSRWCFFEAVFEQTVSVCVCCTGTWPSFIHWNHDSRRRPPRWSLCVSGCSLWFWPSRCVSFRPSKNCPNGPSATLPGRDLQKTLSCECYLNMQAKFKFFFLSC